MADHAEQVLLALLRIRGPSGHEGQVMKWLRDRLRQSGVPANSINQDGAHRRSPVGGEAGNLALRLPGRGRMQTAPRRLLMAHVDTVPQCVGVEPAIRAGRVIARGGRTALGGDDRSGVAILVLTLERLLAERPDHPPLTFLWTVQEEAGLFGARYAATRPLGRPRMGFNFDLSDPTQIIIGATGAEQVTIDVRGVASHAGVAPEQGVSANVAAARAIARLAGEGWHGRIRKRDGRTWREGTSNVGMLHGGLATNVVTESATVVAEIRGHEPAFRARILEAYRQAFTDAAASTGNAAGRSASVDFIVRHQYEAYELSPDDPGTQAAVAALRRLGLEAQYHVDKGGGDANWLTHHGIPTVTLGCGQHDIHTVDEYIDLAEFHTAQRIAWRLATAED